MGVECPPYKTGYGFILGGGQLNSHNPIIGVEVPSRQANFDKIRQITILDDLPGGGAQYGKIQNSKRKHLKKALFQEQNPGG